MAIDATPEHWGWREGPSRPGPAVVFDMDGVLSDATGRQHFLEYPRRDWDAFFAACGDDALIDEVARLLEVLDPTSRSCCSPPGRCGCGPRRWPGSTATSCGGTCSSCATSATTRRPAASSARPSTSCAATGFDLRLAFEDDRRNVDMFHAEGIPCVYIHSGYYD